jgi:hypothetical protein
MSVLFLSRRGRIFLKPVKKINYSNVSVNQSPARTFVQIQKQMSMPMDQLCKNLQFTWPFTEKFLDIYGRGKNSPKRSDKGQRINLNAIWNLISNNCLWLEFKIICKELFKWLSSITRWIFFDFPSHSF